MSLVVHTIKVTFLLYSGQMITSISCMKCHACTLQFSNSSGVKVASFEALTVAALRPSPDWTAPLRSGSRGLKSTLKCTLDWGSYLNRPLVQWGVKLQPWGGTGGGEQRGEGEEDPSLLKRGTCASEAYNNGTIPGVRGFGRFKVTSVIICLGIGPW